MMTTRATTITTARATTATKIQIAMMKTMPSSATMERQQRLNAIVAKMEGLHRKVESSEH